MMPVSPARLAAFDILLRIDMQDAYSSELLHSERMDELFPQDRGLCMELVMGVLRWRSRLDAQIAKLSFTPFRKLDPEVVTALRLGAYQVQFLGRIPARAAINESVELVKHARKMSAAPLVNAVLRKLPAFKFIYNLLNKKMLIFNSIQIP
jgi:16S rRNA (cytosine967-C5)-methyltransferase